MPQRSQLATYVLSSTKTRISKTGAGEQRKRSEDDEGPSTTL